MNELSSRPLSQYGCLKLQRDNLPANLDDLINPRSIRKLSFDSLCLQPQVLERILELIEYSEILNSLTIECPLENHSLVRKSSASRSMALSGQS